MPQSYANFREFYSFYLSEHANRTCRRLHFIGSSLVLIALAATAVTGHWVWLWVLPFFGYGFAWTGHYFFERNRPATFKHPFYSFLGDWVMFKDMLIRRIRF